ncbi:UDP-3-O-(3-hydroxymyristoyl)glucosamine N-acyltransferase [Silvibacterium acidisoli]|uniref:UDP-3-O-(3-hydroxymyristoyl)glucosamine N-acyltransferase n=1 Tax=Acidobacteriaceae bacterium ZG23-2 TaxID=2883246 RepID=UPI00406C7C6C
MRLVQLAELLDTQLKGDAKEKMVSRVSSVRDADAESVVFAEDPIVLAHALKSAAVAVIVSYKLSVDLPETSTVVLIAKQPKLAFARAAKLLRPQVEAAGVHETAIVDGSALLGRRLTVEAYAVVGKGAKLGDGSFIGAGAVIGEGVIIGQNCRIYPRVVLYPGVELGDNVIVHAGAVLGGDGFGYVRDEETGEYLQFPQQGRLVIEDGVEIGANTTIDRGALEETRIARGVKIDNLVHIGHNVTVERDVVIAAQTGISGSSTIRAQAIVGGQVGIGDHAEVGEKVILGSGSGVLTHKKVKGAGVVFWGRPARPLKQYLKELATLAKLARKD